LAEIQKSGEFIPTKANNVSIHSLKTPGMLAFDFAKIKEKLEPP
jgi:hypothetical protein